MRIKAIVAAGCALALLLAAGCGEEKESADEPDAPAGAAPAAAGSFSLSSSSFENEGEIGEKYACAGEGGSDISPQLSWSGAPASTYSYAVVMDDETPPCDTGDGACMHWSVFNIPEEVNALAEGEDPTAIDGVATGRNYTGGDGYAGPCPPDDHVYRITVFALGDGAPPVGQGEAYTRSSFESSYREYIVSLDTIEGTFRP